MKPLTTTSYFAYGLFGLPLALLALPVYVYVPQFYAERFGLSLTLIGATLLIARVFDAFIDPLIGMWLDRSRSTQRYQRYILLALPLLVCGFVALFHPPQFAQDAALHAALLWFMATLLLVYLGFSLASIAYQSWGAALTQQLQERSALTATREACGLAGVILAATLTGWLGLSWLSAIFVISLLLSSAVLLRLAPKPPPLSTVGSNWQTMLVPFQSPRFRWLFAVLIVNGIAASIPATLFLFFAQDQLQLPHYAGLFLLLYFVAAACSMPLWVALAKRHGEARIWLLAMFLSAAAFVWAYGLSAGAAWSFGLICVLSGLTLGADLALPPALLAAVIAQAGHSGQREGAYFGAWSWATKMNLALAAGIALPLLQQLGYVPGVVNSDGAHALAIGYALLPCCLKLCAATILWRAPLRDI